MRGKKYRIGNHILLWDETREAEPKACIAKTTGNNETERIRIKKILKGLKLILIEDRAVIKVNFQCDIK